MTVHIILFASRHCQQGDFTPPKYVAADKRRGRSKIRDESEAPFAAEGAR
jgi:hypothetical protein